MARILVTGGAGYVGSVCCAQLLARGHHVEVADDLSTGFADAVPQGAVLHRVSIADDEALSAILAHRRLDTVFHFAAKALIPESVANPGAFFDANVASGISLLETLRKHEVCNFVFSSSAAVYGTPHLTPIPEEHPKEPVNAYGESKFVFERILKWYAEAYGWSVVAFRYFNACGGGQTWGERHEPETHVIPLLLQAASGRRDYFEIFGADYATPDGTCLRDFVHVLDIAEAHVLALTPDKPGFRAYNIGTGKSYSVIEICRAARRITGKQIEIRTAPRRPGDPAELCASPKRLKNEFGWCPKHSELENILVGAWEWEEQQSKAGAIEGLTNANH
ncbi:MAG TPA: UDP-glucose 4-epimerase GalE [Candidatus Sulfotelmatobacter sp.]|nr:UDP-glucose 4-epimerase GalE [Candidatus Sulfotelmatobacter sp.]